MTTLIETMILRRRALLFVPAGSENSDRDLSAFELALAEAGYVLKRDLREALLTLTDAEFNSRTSSALKELYVMCGGNVQHRTLFTNFPHNIPTDTQALYAERMLSMHFQLDSMPCFHCDNDAVHAVNPCGHLVCDNCFDPKDYDGCPICGQIVSATPTMAKPKIQNVVTQAPKFLGLATDLTALARDTAEQLLSRQTPLNPQDKLDLLALVDYFGDEILTLTEEIPLKETLALVCAVLIQRSDDPVTTLEKCAEHLKTATDLLRVLNIYISADTDADLTGPMPRRKTISRPMRRAILAILEKFPLDRLGEDMQRHDKRWVSFGQSLRPFDYHNQFPNTAVSFMSLRRTKVDPDSPLAKTLEAVVGSQPQTAGSVKTALTVRLRTHSSLVESSLRTSNLDALLALLSDRPGDFGRRLDQIARLVDRDHPQRRADLLAALVDVCKKMTTPMLFMLRAHLSTRHDVVSRRVFFPKGSITTSHAITDMREPLSDELLQGSLTIIFDELVSRGEKLAVRDALLDRSIQNLLVPHSERNASKAMVNVPRGSVLPLPEGEKIRLFLHWMQKDHQHIDLDLSVAMYDSEWNFVNLCDYTRLNTFYDDSAVHSGDFTSAPAPTGASEFIDLDVEKLRARGVRHLAMIVFAYNNIPFEDMEEAFAGFSSVTDKTFDAKATLQRFDLTGPCRVAMPMFVDLEKRHMLWADLKPNAENNGVHNVVRHRAKLGLLGCDMSDYYMSGARPNLFDVSLVRASSANRIQVREMDGMVSIYTRHENEPSNAFLGRVSCGTYDELVENSLELGDGSFTATDTLDLNVPHTATVYSLRSHVAPAETATVLEASDLVAFD